MEDNLRQQMTFVGRRPLLEDDVCLKKTFVERQPLVEEDLEPNIDPNIEYQNSLIILII